MLEAAASSFGETFFKGNKMKMTKIALAIACLVGSTQAFAVGVTPADIAAAGAGLQQAWITGASAPTKSIYEGWVGSGAGVGCDAGTNTIFSNDATTANIPGGIGNFNAYACKRGGVVSVLYHTVDGGSLFAYSPHTLTPAAKLSRLRNLAINTACVVQAAATPAVPSTNTTAAYIDLTNRDNDATVYKSCARVGVNTGTNLTTINAASVTNGTALNGDLGAPQLPVGGFSDVEAAILPSTLGGGDVSNQGTEAAANIGQVFGVVTSVPLYRALQMSQGITAVGTDFDTDGAGPDTGFDGTFDPALAPNITSAQYASIAAISGKYHSSWAPIVGTTAGNTGAGKKMILARRVATSGTQASSNAFFLKNPCATGALANLNPAVAQNLTNFEVVEAPGTTDVKVRITTASNSAGADNFAIGVVSAENDWRAETNVARNGYRFVKVDGVHPETGDTANARRTAISGAYPFHMETQYFVANTAPAGFGADVLVDIAAALAAPPTVASCAVLPRGLTLNPLGGSICTATEVAKVTNFNNSCAPQQLQN